MNIKPVVQQAVADKDYTELLALIPYAQHLGMNCEQLGEELVFRLPNNPDNMGNPMLPALHGGVIAGFMEMSAMVQLMVILRTARVPKIVDFSIDYLRAGYARETYAECRITRQGRRVANVSVSCWQTNRKQPIATARAHFLID
ncbi:PaaI family thioesterase [Ferrimonas sediminicola]|uniref:PaaI family thioesterase n=1 Tax=Ferrimonas sediminicola TaxID=2569538 RepID=A0A4U1BGY2_9GAMM|nr:PaaI family thioesterase [Ferrimonas sediminicola]TKB50618.1 PaaI family thioesterase [Ferrimonas sediminicola]